MKHRKLLPPFFGLLVCGVLVALFVWPGWGTDLVAGSKQEPPSQMRIRFTNKTNCNLGTVTFHYPGQSDVLLNITGNGVFESPEIRNGIASSVTILGVNYATNAMPSAMTCNGEDHTVYSGSPIYYDGHICWQPYQLNGG